MSLALTADDVVATDGLAREGGPAVRRPWLWLLAVLGLGLALRGWRLGAPLQQDEFGSLYAVAERASARPGWTPTTNDPLLPVATLGEVRDRSVLPYGIVNPVPVYHGLLYFVVRVLPVAEWSLRLPSLLAGLASIVVLYLLCRRLLGTEVALAAALLAALDPLHAGASVLARPYALGNLASVLSFLGLLLVLHGRHTRGRAGGTLLYGLALALMGYLNSVLLLVVVGHLSLVAYWWFGRPRLAEATGREPNPAPWSFREAPPRSRVQLGWWLAGCALAASLLLPEWGYIRQLQDFNREHGGYLLELWPPRLHTILLHNSTFLMGLLVISAAGFVGARTSRPQLLDEPLPPENPDLLWLGRCWLFLPQLAVVLLAFSLGWQVLLSRYLCYTTFGAVILLAYWATREGRADRRRKVIGVVALVMLVWGLTPFPGLGGLVSPSEAPQMADMLKERDEKQRIGKDDLILYRAGFLEADLLPDDIPCESLAHVEGVLAAPLTTLYVGPNPHPYVVLSHSHRRNDTKRTRGGRLFNAESFYNDDLAARVRPHDRYWICAGGPDRQAYVDCLLCWLADAQPWDLTVARRRDYPEHYFLVPGGIGPDDYVAGLSDSRPDDFPAVFLARRGLPRGAFALGALSASLAPNAHVTVPVWLVTQCPTPRPGPPPAPEGDAEGEGDRELGGLVGR
jgi:hypothetical protein